MKIFIVEDEPTITDNSCYALETEGFESRYQRRDWAKRHF